MRDTFDQVDAAGAANAKKADFEAGRPNSKSNYELNISRGKGNPVVCSLNSESGFS